MEFVLLLPILVATFVGILEFGYHLFLQQSAEQAAREAVRSYAINYTDGESATEEASEIAEASAPRADQVSSVHFTQCVTGGEATVVVTYTYAGLTGWLDFIFPPTIVGTGIMQCEG